MKNEFRTTEQFLEIVDSCLNGNWTTAAEECVKFGFYANDLIRKQEELSVDGLGFDDPCDIARVIESATRLRYEK